MKTLQIKKDLVKVFVALFAISLFSFQQASAQTNLVTVRSAKNFDATVSNIKKGVSGAGMMVLAEINHGKILSMTGLSMKGESFFIGNPTVGNQALSENVAVGLAIPIRLNVYEEKGVTYINYFTPSSELASFQGTKVKMIGQEMDKKLAMLTAMVTK